MADSKKGIKEGEVVGAPIVQSTTEATPSPADETPMPNHLNTDPEQPPVRTGRPDVPVAQTLVAGAGAHTPPDPDVYDPEGRLRDVPNDTTNQTPESSRNAADADATAKGR